MAELYNHKVVEKKWQKVWDDEKAFAATNDFTKPKYYALVEFPYPSGQCMKSPEQVRKNLEQLENAWNNYQVYMNDEINFINEDSVLTESFLNPKETED